LACRVWLPRRGNRPATRDAGALGWATVRSLGSLADSVRDGLELPGKPVNWQSALCTLLGCGHLRIIGPLIALRYQLLDQVMQASDLRAQYNMPAEWRLDVDQSGVARRSVTQTSAAEWLAAKIGQHTPRGT
jgi:hypothetical protein